MSTEDPSVRQFQSKSDFYDDYGHIDQQLFIESAVSSEVFRDAVADLENSRQVDVPGEEWAKIMGIVQQTLGVVLLRVSTLSLVPSDLLHGSYGKGSERLEWIPDGATLTEELSSRGLNAGDIVDLPNSELGGVRKLRDEGRVRLPPMSVVTADGGSTFFMLETFTDTSGKPQYGKVQVNDAVLKVFGQLGFGTPADTSGALNVDGGLVANAKDFKDTLSLPTLLRDETGKTVVVVDGTTRWIRDASTQTYFEEVSGAFDVIGLSNAELSSFQTIFAEDVRVLEDGTLVRNTDTGEISVYRGGLNAETLTSHGFRNNPVMDFVRLVNLLVDAVPSSEPQYGQFVVKVAQMMAQLSMLVNQVAQFQFGQYDDPDSYIPTEGSYESIQNDGSDGHQHTWIVPDAATVASLGEVWVVSEYDPNIDHHHELRVPSSAGPGDTLQTFRQDNPSSQQGDHTHEVTLPSSE